MKPPSGVVLSCEHGGHRVPARVSHLFAGLASRLESHRGHDPGAADLTRRLARALGAPAFVARVSRLVVDLNRSPGLPALRAGPARGIVGADRERLLDRHYWPFRRAVEAALREALARGGGPVLHLSCHSFTPVLDGRERRADVALLYDPRRPGERAFADLWLAGLALRRPFLVLRRNYPYRGVADGHTTWLRRRLPPGCYLGLELEVNQRFPLGPRPEWRRLQEDLEASLREALGGGLGRDTRA
ncbi:MAG: N-formylglutamate amidohydrolase [Planctomycetes bacterium]|nr:N-formylglutamate amidohydrolase [Planctomycetota bacterium]